MVMTRKPLFLLLVPLAAGIVANHLLLDLYAAFLWFLSAAFIIFWFGVGMRFARLGTGIFTSFLLGNSIWAISLLLYVWQFVIVDDDHRITFLALLSQYYMLFTVPEATLLAKLYTDVLDGTAITLLSYALMFVIFTLGFGFQHILKRKNHFASPRV